MSATLGVEAAPAPAEPAARDAAADPPVLRPWLRLAPILAFQLYLNLSVFLFAFGPWRWPVPDPEKLYGFVALAHAALLAGYLSAARGRPRGYFGAIRPRTLLLAGVGLTLLLFVPTLVRTTGGSISIREAFSDPASVYYRYQERVEMWAGGGAGGGIITYLRLLAAPLLALVMPLVARHWGTLSLSMRAAGVTAILSNLSLYFFTGRNKGITDIVLMIPWLFAIYMVAGRKRFRVRPMQVAAGVLLFSGALWFFLDYYGRNTSGRALIPNADIFFSRALGGMQADPENFMIRNRPPESQAVVLALTFTQSHGYYGLALSLEKPFEPGWGIGHSSFLQGLEYRFTGRAAAREHSYPGRLESQDGWSYNEFWHNIYPWLASDLSFPGTILAVFVLGRLLAQAWLDSLRGDNPYAIGFLVLLVTMLYYFPTNNIVLGFGETLTAFWGLLLLWRITRRPVRAGRAPFAAGAA